MFDCSPERRVPRPRPRGARPLGHSSHARRTRGDRRRRARPGRPARPRAPGRPRPPGPRGTCSTTSIEPARTRTSRTATSAASAKDASADSRRLSLGGEPPPGGQPVAQHPAGARRRGRCGRSGSRRGQLQPEEVARAQRHRAVPSAPTGRRERRRTRRAPRARRGRAACTVVARGVEARLATHSTVSSGVASQEGQHRLVVAGQHHVVAGAEHGVLPTDREHAVHPVQQRRRLRELRLDVGVV